MESGFKIAIVGLGIIGGSVAYSLNGFKDGKIFGYDINPKTRAAAKASGAVDVICDSAGDAIENADLIILATYPKGIVKTVAENQNKFKCGAVITDICGVKTKLCEEMKKVLPKGVDYVGGHPMAGKEVDGFENASSDMFKGCGFIITPIEDSEQESIDLVLSMARYMGAERIAINTPKAHDEIIAYTSDLMHIAASALCLDYHEDMNLAYTAGAYRDCTRIAYINPELWTELFMENAENTVVEIDKLINSVTKLRNAINNRDAEGLCSLLTTVRDNKIEMMGR